jgi:hypothetical protein
MDELRRLCVRMLGDGEAARAAEQEARATGADGRTAILNAGLVSCRRRAAAASEPRPLSEPGSGLADAVAHELAVASARLPESQREALALREMLGLSYEELAAVAGMDEPGVAPLLAGARMALRTELRGAAALQPDCADRDRALRTMALRHDGQVVSSDDDDWLMEHLGHCRGCGQAHAAMLEATACYLAWSPVPGALDSDRGGGAGADPGGAVGAGADAGQ